MKYQQYEHHHPIHTPRRPTYGVIRSCAGGIEFLLPLPEESGGNV